MDDVVASTNSVNADRKDITPDRVVAVASVDPVIAWTAGDGVVPTEGANEIVPAPAMVAFLPRQLGPTAPAAIAGGHGEGRQGSASAPGEDAELVALRVGQDRPRHVALADVDVGGAESPQPGHLSAA